MIKEGVGTYLDDSTYEIKSHPRINSKLFRRMSSQIATDVSMNLLMIRPYTICLYIHKYIFVFIIDLILVYTNIYYR